MANNSPIDDLNWLNSNPKLEELVARYPKVWQETEQNITRAANTQQIQKLKSHSDQAKSTVEFWKLRIEKSGGNPQVIKAAVPQLVKSRMSLHVLERCFLAANAKKITGKVRFNLVNGWIIQRLLFSRDLVRKQISMRRFRFFWRFITQKRLLIPLVQSRGIYCFYSRDLIQKLAALLAGRSCLEIGAGDGTLARFLREQGAEVTATDDLSWAAIIDYPQDVENLRAKQALAKYQPKVVLCSWPPPDNNFEQYVFATKSVETYIVIGSPHRFVSGNWDTYAKQQEFEWAKDEELSSLVIPPELDSAVLVFRRKTGLASAVNRS